MVNIQKDSILAVHDKDLEDILDGLGILNKLKSGKLKCKFCKNIITLENLHSIFPQSRSIKLVCDNPNCIKELHALLRDGDFS